MKNNIKIIIIVLVVLVIGGVVAYYKKPNQSLPKNDTPVVLEESVVGTYVANLAKDVYTLTVTSQQGELFKGELNIKNYEKDSSSGSLVGTYKNGILLADYTFNSEGTKSVNQVIFKKLGNDFIRGYGDVDTDTGTRFIDINNITYDTSVVYKKVSPGAEKTQVNTVPKGKLNIDLVCEKSLSYMKFKDSASADKFIAECKEGKHPEVIEHYKAELNLGEGVKI